MKEPFTLNYFSFMGSHSFFFVPILGLWVFCLSVFCSPGSPEPDLLEKRFLRSSVIVEGTVERSGFEAPAPDRIVQKFFMTLRIRQTFKGDFVRGDTVEILVGGKTLMDGKLYQVGDTDLLPGSRAVFFLQYLFPDERDFSSGVPYFMDVVMNVISDSVYTPSPNPRHISLQALAGMLLAFRERYDFNNLLARAATVTKARIGRIQEAGYVGGKYQTVLLLDSLQVLRGPRLSDTLAVVLADDCRRIHYRHRKKTDIPFYISKDRKSLQAENTSNFFLTQGETLVFLLCPSPEKLTVCGGYTGIFNTDLLGKVWNRTVSITPRAIPAPPSLSR